MDKLSLTLDMAPQIPPAPLFSVIEQVSFQAEVLLPITPSLCSPGLPSAPVWSATGVGTWSDFCWRSQSRWDEVHTGFMPTLLQQWEYRRHLIQQKTSRYNLSQNFQINLNYEGQFVLNQHFASLACGILHPIPKVLAPDLLCQWTTTSASVKQDKSRRERLYFKHLWNT